MTTPALRTGYRTTLAVLLAMLLVASLDGCNRSDRAKTVPTASHPPEAPRAGMPTDYFVENVGQVESSEVLYYHRTRGYDVGFCAGSILIRTTNVETAPSPVPAESIDILDASPARTARSIQVRMVFVGSRPTVPVVRSRRPFRTSYLLGAEPTGWRVDVGTYGELVYEDIYDGIDLVFTPNREGLKYEFRVEPGALVQAISIRYEGIEGLEIAGSGEAVLQTELGEIRDSAPVALQDGRDEIACSFSWKAPDTYGFHVPTWDRDRPLVIDPLIYATFIGGSDADLGVAIDVDATGHAYLAGETRSVDFPATVGAFDTTANGASDGFVAKLDPSGSTLIWATYVGGSDFDGPRSIEVNGAGEAHVTGDTQSDDFPTTPGAFDETANGGRDGFVLKMQADGASLVYSTYLGGLGLELSREVRLDDAGSAYICGDTHSDGFPTTAGAFQEMRIGPRECFLTKLDAAGALVYSTYIGGSDFDSALGLDIGSGGEAFVGGTTRSADFPTTVGAYDTTINGLDDGFVLRMNAAGSDLIYGTFIGGSDMEQVWNLAVDPAGCAHLVGTTPSLDYPTTPGAFDAVLDGPNDATISKFDPSGSALLYSTFLGGSGNESGFQIRIDSSGNAHVVGTTSSADFPIVTGAIGTVLGGPADAYATRLDPTGSVLLGSTYIGGSDRDTGFGLALAGGNDIFVTGSTRSADFPVTPGAFDEIRGGAEDGYVARLGFLGPNRCPHSQGFWKNHGADWPVTTLTLGGESYGQDELLELLRTPSRGDASVILAKQLIAARLNVANGSDPGPIAAELQEADDRLASQSGRLPLEVRSKTLLGQQMLSVKDVLDEYNNGGLTPNCDP